MPIILLGSGFPDPTSVAGLTGWWDADQLVYSDAGTTPAVNNDPVYRWTARAGSPGGNLDQTTLGNRPTYKTAIVNGHNVLRFDNSNDYVQGAAISNFLTNSAKTIFTVHYHSTGAGIGTLIGDGSGKIAFYVNNTGGDLIFANDDGGVDTATNTAQSTTTWTIGTGLHSSGNIYCGVSDTRTASMNSAASGNTNLMTGILLVGVQAGVINPFGGDIAAVLTFNVALNETDRQTVERYLAWLYNISIPY